MGLTVNRQMAKKLTVNRQKPEYFYRQPSNERAKISRQISQISLNDQDRLIFSMPNVDIIYDVTIAVTWDKRNTNK